VNPNILSSPPFFVVDSFWVKFRAIGGKGGGLKSGGDHNLTYSLVGKNLNFSGGIKPGVKGPGFTKRASPKGIQFNLGGPQRDSLGA